MAGGGRFTDGRVPDAGIRELFDREHRWEAWLQVEAALALAEAELDMIPQESAQRIAAVATLDHLDVERIRAGIARASHPLMPLVTELARAAGEPHGGWVHWGATTQNITQTGDLLVVRAAHQIILRLVREILLNLARLAQRGADMVMAGRTHGQHAVPITFGFKVAAWVDELSRHLTRLEQVEDRVFVAIVGGAVGTFASFGPHGPQVQVGVARRLGLGVMPVPARGTVDHLVEYVCVLALIAGWSGRVAREIFTLMKPEFGEAAEPVPEGTVGSSTMPHKRNPQLCQDMIAIGAEIRALVPLALESMIQDHEVDGASTDMLSSALSRACVLTGDLLERGHLVLAGLELHPGRMRDNLDLTQGLIMSESVMLALGAAIGRQEAHDVVYEATHGNERDFADALAADPRIAAHLDAEEIHALLDPATHIGLSAQLARQAARTARERAAEVDQN